MHVDVDQPIAWCRECGEGPLTGCGADAVTRWPPHAVERLPDGGIARGEALHLQDERNDARSRVHSADRDPDLSEIFVVGELTVDELTTDRAVLTSFVKRSLVCLEVAMQLPSVRIEAFFSLCDDTFMNFSFIESGGACG